MDYIKNLFLKDYGNPIREVNKDQHIYRSRMAENELVSTPLYPKLNKEDCTIDKVWKSTVEANSDKRVFGARDLVKVCTKKRRGWDETVC
jgi:hypothetical protein